MLDPFESFGKILAILGGFLLLTGILIYFGKKIPFLGKLPGDFYFKISETRVFIPIATCIVISIVLTILLNLILRILK